MAEIRIIPPLTQRLYHGNHSGSVTVLLTAAFPLGQCLGQPEDAEATCAAWQLRGSKRDPGSAEGREKALMF